MHRTLLALATGLLLATGVAADPLPARPRIDITTSMGVIRATLFADEAPATVATVLGLATGEKPFTDAAGAPAQRPFYDGLTFHRVIDGFMIQGGDPLGTGAGGPGFQFADEINATSLGLDRETVFIGPGMTIDDINPQCRHQMAQFGQLYLRPKLDELGFGPTTPPEQVDAAVRNLLPDLRRVTLQAFFEKLGYRYDGSLPPSHRPLRGSLAMANSGPNTNGSQFFINLVDTPHLTGKHTVFGEVTDGMAVVEAIAKVQVDQAGRPAQPVTIVSIRPVAAPTAK
jgi:cyclophilin family peptidyl-prolyl cis-trans isomerase